MLNASSSDNTPLFSADDDWWHNACIHFCSDRLDLYADGYKRAADIIVKKIVDGAEKGLNDILVYPVAFLYRHYLELRLKHIIQYGSLLLDRPAPDLHSYRHNLNGLLDTCLGISRAIFKNESEVDLSSIQRVIKEYADIDPGGQAFRYAKDAKNNVTLPKISHLNLRKLASHIHEVSTLLDGASCGIDQYLSDKAEYERNS